MKILRKNINIIFLSLCSVFTANIATAQTPTANNKTQKPVTQNLGISASQFKANFNKLALQLDAPQIKALNLKSESNGQSFSIQMPSHLAIIGNTDSKGILTRLSVGLDVTDIPRNELGDHSMMLGGFAITAIKAVDNNKADEKRDDAVQDIYEALWKDKKTFTSANMKNKVYKSYKLAAYSNPKIGVIMVGVEPQ